MCDVGSVKKGENYYKMYITSGVYQAKTTTILHTHTVPIYCLKKQLLLYSGYYCHMGITYSSLLTPSYELPSVLGLEPGPEWAKVLQDGLHVQLVDPPARQHRQRLRPRPRLPQGQHVPAEGEIGNGYHVSQCIF